MRLAVALLGLWLALSVLAPWLPLAPDAVHLERILAAPALETGAWLGCDELGRPLADRLLTGARVSLEVMMLVVAGQALLGVGAGLVGGYLGGPADRLLRAVTDLTLAFPGLLLALLLAGLLGPGVDNVVIALVAVGWVGFARLTRAQVLSLKRSDHVAAAIALGCGHARILRRHLLPLLAAPLLVETVLACAGAITAEAGLSFLGLGVQPPQASWGGLIREGARYLLVAPHYLLLPGTALVAVIYATGALGEHLRRRLDPKDET
ncbi:ABC transporter permease [Immundisolibacter sp.]|uniref:ABC transporter permease n=1 Tax=Immundisolibacter sp. TaxID=1934948 RepID=UPI00262F375C|nr:ABC transporter permease [Immundisolibacter sp.]MDD3651440.1 ABC transporter permease [Immundisolibacter sp.]